MKMNCERCGTRYKSGERHGCFARTPKADDPINHPTHYTSHPSGVEAITVCEWMNFNIGNAMKYIWRAGLKGNARQDLSKAAWYLTREIQRLDKMEGKK